MEEGYTLARDLAKELGVSASTMAKWLRGESGPGVRVFLVYDGRGIKERTTAVLTKDVETVRAAWKAYRAPIEVTK